MENKDGFKLTYSAKQQAEIRQIRDKYTGTPKNEEESNIEKLRRLDKKVTDKATAFSLIVGISGTLLLGIGMSLSMSDFGKILGEYASLSMPVGIVVGLLGLGLACMALPVYNLALKRGRKKAAPEIIRLSEKLLK